MQHQIQSRSVVGMLSVSSPFLILTIFSFLFYSFSFSPFLYSLISSFLSFFSIVESINNRVESIDQASQVKSVKQERLVESVEHASLVESIKEV